MSKSKYNTVNRQENRASILFTCLNRSFPNEISTIIPSMFNPTPVSVRVKTSKPRGMGFRTDISPIGREEYTCSPRDQSPNLPPRCSCRRSLSYSVSPVHVSFMGQGSRHSHKVKSPPFKCDSQDNSSCSDEELSRTSTKAIRGSS